MTPDLFASVNINHLRKLKGKGLMNEHMIYVHNKLELMVAKGNRCQPWRAKRGLVVPSRREAALFPRRALRQRGNKVGLRTRRPVIGSWLRSSNELAMLLRSSQ